ncbi:MAG: hypothetical protein KAR31_02290 [Candidatus Omnitrophica bacterium]|nr:hypothetical protein [Candidatus Omnitrophota bacterium]
MTHDVNIGLAVWLNVFFRLVIMMLISMAVISYALLLGKNTEKRQPQGVLLFGVFLILGSIYKLWGFLNYDYYQFMFQQLSEEIVFMRYFGSVMLRIVGLIVATGVLLLNDISRKILIVLCVGTLFSLYWKHPFFVFENISRYTEQQFFQEAVIGELTYPAHPWISLIFNYIVDIVFCGSALFYFTRPKVRAQFH